MGVSTAWEGELGLSTCTSRADRIRAPPRTAPPRISERQLFVYRLPLWKILPAARVCETFPDRFKFRRPRQVNNIYIFFKAREVREGEKKIQAFVVSLG